MSGIATPEQPRRDFRELRLAADLVVVGGGMAGTCAAITAARAGAEVTLIQDRPVLGGNASSEVRVFVIGATNQGAGNNRWAREGGVLDEILVENTFRNPDGNPVIFDTVLLEKVAQEPSITLLLNTAVFDVRLDDARIGAVRAFCSQNSTMYEVTAPLFCDASGDGVLGYLSGAAFRVGAESRDEFGEGFAPSEEYGSLLGHTIFFYVKDTGAPVTFIPPSFAAEDVSKTRIPQKFQGVQRVLKTIHHGCMLNWIEYGGRLDTVHDTEQIKWELWRYVYGAWHYLKNSGEYPEMENLTLEWVGSIPGKRESRRFEGLHMLTQHDIVAQRVHEDAVAYGGWSIDLHPGDGIFSEHPSETFLWPKGVYQIPYRSYVSRSVPNLFLAGRIISASHVAFGSTRVMATCANGGQAVGMAAAMCARQGLDPADLLAPERMEALQRALLRTGQHIPRLPLRDPDDLVRSATVSASSELELRELPTGGRIVPLTRSHAQVLPVRRGPVPTTTFVVDVESPTTLHVEVRVSADPENHTPDVTLETLAVALEPGHRQDVAVAPTANVDDDRYVYVCLMKNPAVSVHMSIARVTGLLSLHHHGTQQADEVLGRPRMELWGPVGGPYWVPSDQTHGFNLAVRVDPPIRAFAAANVRNGYARPTSHPNAWVAAPSDPAPTLVLAWDSPVEISRVELAFDTDFDHPLLSVVIPHPERAMPFCVRHYRIRAGGKIVAEVTDNHQTRRTHVFDRPLVSAEVAIEIVDSNGDTPPSVLEVRCYRDA